MKPAPSQITTVIFDFDGVIADSGAVFAETLAEVMKRSEPFSDAEIKHMQTLSPRQIITYLGIKKWQIPLVMAKGKKGIAARMPGVEVFPGMPEAIRDLHAKGYVLYILSTNSNEAISTILERYDLKDCFTHIYSATRVFGKAKRLEALLRRERVAKEYCVYIGDEVRDVEATKQVGIPCVAVEWGYSAPEALKSYEPSAMVSQPSQLSQVIAKL